jgi:23S rRNA (adenine2503-C2)-methyltransferase
MSDSGLVGLVAPALGRGRAPRHWADLSPAERATAVLADGLPAFRAKQLSAHYFSHWSAESETWTDLSAAHRRQVSHFFPQLLSLIDERSADDGATLKSLYRLHDGALIETVVMRYGLWDELPSAQSRPAARDVAAPDRPAAAVTGWHDARTTLCLSTQAGCGMNCPFCATGQRGLERNLSAGEIVEQVRRAGQSLAAGALPGGPGRLNNIVVMGMGEPLANYRAVLQALRVAVAPVPAGFGLSARGITLSTVGLVPGIRRLAGEGLPLTLAISLHAADDALRDELVPVNRHYPIDAVLDAAWDYAQATKRRVSIEYALMRDVNDQPEQADRLAGRLLSRGDWGWCHVNLIRFNPTPRSRWTASRRPDEARFRARLEARGVPVTVRQTRGRQIDAACGQLAAGHSATDLAGHRGPGWETAATTGS